MKRWLGFISLGVVLFVIFFMTTFPFERIGPLIVTQVEKALNQSIGRGFQCEGSGFGYAFPFGAQFERLKCSQRRSEVFDLRDLKITALPYSQKISTFYGNGQLELETNIGLSGQATRVSGELNKIDLGLLAPLAFDLAGRLGQRIFIRPEFEGLIDGQFELPLQNFKSGSGYAKLKVNSLRMPQQLILSQIGLTELEFNKAEFDVQLEDGTVNFNQADLLSDILSAKLSGSLNLSSETRAPTGNMTFKWKVRESDALRRSSFGGFLLNADCPSRDSEGFCSKRITQFSEIGNHFTRGAFR